MWRREALELEDTASVFDVPHIRLRKDPGFTHVPEPSKLATARHGGGGSRAASAAGNSSSSSAHRPRSKTQSELNAWWKWLLTNARAAAAWLMDRKLRDHIHTYTHTSVSWVNPIQSHVEDVQKPYSLVEICCYQFADWLIYAIWSLHLF